MGNKQVRQITTTDIETEINIELENITKNINKVYNESVTDVSSKLIMKNVQEMDTGTGGANVMILGEVVISDDSVVDLNQELSIEAIHKACMNLVQDLEMVSTLTEELTQDIFNKIQNDNELKQDLEAAATIDNSKKKAGGIADMVNAAFDVINTMMQPNQTITSENRTSIRNKVMLKVRNEIVNVNDLKNIIKTNIENSLNAENRATCRNIVGLSNTIDIREINATGNTKLSLKQSASVNAVTDCIISAVQKGNMIQDISKATKTISKTDTSNKNKTDQTAKVDNKVTNKDETGSAIEDLVGAFSPAGIASAFSGPGGIAAMVYCFCLCCCVLIVGGIFIYLRMGGGKSMMAGMMSSQMSMPPIQQMPPMPPMQPMGYGQPMGYSQYGRGKTTKLFYYYFNKFMDIIKSKK